MPRHPRAFRPESFGLEARQLLAARVVARALPATVPWVGFERELMWASQQSDSATITLERSPAGSSAPLDVRLTTAPSPAVGVNLPAVDRTVSFAAGETKASVTIPINAGAANPGEVDVTLGVSRADGPAEQVYARPMVLTLKAAADATPPTIIARTLTRRGLVLTFSEPMDPASVQNVASYYVEAKVKTGDDIKNALGRFLTSWTGEGEEVTKQKVRLRSADYDPASRTVTLVPARRLANANFTVVSAAQAPGRSARRFRVSPPPLLADLAGNTIAADTDRPGQFTARVTKAGKA